MSDVSNSKYVGKWPAVSVGAFSDSGDLSVENHDHVFCNFDFQENQIRRSKMANGPKAALNKGVLS